MSAASPDTLLAGFQWLVIPHGLTAEGRLRVTVRVMPQLHPDFFAGAYRVGMISDEVGRRAVLDWPKFLDKGVKLQIAATRPGSALQSASAGLNGTGKPIDLTAAWRQALAAHGARPGLAGDLWRKLVHGDLAVEFGKTGSATLDSESAKDKSASGQINYLAALPHAAGATVLRKTVGDIYATGLAAAATQSGVSRLSGREGLHGEVRVSLGNAEMTSLRSLSELMASLGPAVRASGILRFSNDVKPLADWSIRRIAATGFQLSEQGVEFLKKRIDSWCLGSKTCREITVNGVATYPLEAFIVDRMLALAPDVTPLKNDPEAEPEFHREVGKLAFHPWLLETLGLAISTEIDRDILSEENCALYVAHIEAGGVPIAPALQTRVVCNAGGKGDWFPKESEKENERETLYHKGCVRLSAGQNGDPAFVLEQLDVDATAEKLIQAAQSMQSQFESGMRTSEQSVVLASLPTTGISMLMKKPAEKEKAVRDAMIKAMAGQSNVKDFYANQLVIGYRADIAPLAPHELGGACHGQWKSLMGRKLHSLKADGDDWARMFKEPPQDEAIITAMARVPTPGDVPAGDAQSQWRLHFEEVFRWRGWSLAAPPVESAEAAGSRAGDGFALSAMYQAAGGLPKQRIGWGYVVGMRVVYADGRSVSLKEAKAVYDDPKSECVLGTTRVGAAGGEKYFLPFFRYEPIQPPDVHLRRRLNRDEIPTERSDYLTVASSGNGERLVRSTERAMVPPRIDLEAAIRMGMFDDAEARRAPPKGAFPDVVLNPDGSFPAVGRVGIARLFGSGMGGETCFVESPGSPSPEMPYLPDPWAKRLIIGIYRRADRPADDRLLGFEYFDYYKERRWPDCRHLSLRIEAAISEALPAEGYDLEWRKDELLIKVAPGTALRLRCWHEMTEQMLADSGVIEAMASYLADDATCRHALGIGDCCNGDLKDVRDRLIRCLSRWHERVSYAVQPHLAAGRPARDVNLTSYSMLNPVRIVEVAHVVAVPVRAPRFCEADALDGRASARLPATNSAIAHRFEVQRENHGITVAKFAGDIEFHRASTARLDCEAEWEEVNDEQGTRFHRMRQRHPMFSIEPIASALDLPIDTARRLTIAPDNDLLLLKGVRSSIGRLDNPDQMCEGKHYDFGDAKARLVNFRLRATSRFLKDFPEGRRDGIRDSGPLTSRWVKATMPPAPPSVVYVVPLFETIAQDRGGTRTQKRRGGWFRIWLERPWFTSGDGELLALVCWPHDLFRPRGGAADYLMDKARRAFGTLDIGNVPEALSSLYCGWGIDPIWEQSATLNYIPPGAFSNRMVMGSVEVVPSQILRGMKPGKADPRVGLALYKPQYDEEEMRWYADVHIEPDGAAYYPFVRLALGRYQPNSIQGCELSEIVTSEFIQLLPERTASVSVERGKSKGEASFVNISIAGPTSLKLSVPPEVNGKFAEIEQNRIVLRIDEARISAGVTGEEAVPAWIPVRTMQDKEEVALDYDHKSGRWTLPQDKPLAYKFQPGVAYSAYLEERQAILLDKEPPSKQEFPYLPDWQSSERVVYADRVLLPI